MKSSSQNHALELLENRRLLSAGDLDTTFGCDGLEKANPPKVF